MHVTHVFVETSMNMISWTFKCNNAYNISIDLSKTKSIDLHNSLSAVTITRTKKCMTDI